MTWISILWSVYGTGPKNMSKASLPFGFLLMLLADQQVGGERDCLFCQIPSFQVAVFCLDVTSITGPSSCLAALPYSYPGWDAPPVLGGNISVLLFIPKYYSISCYFLKPCVCQSSFIKILSTFLVKILGSWSYINFFDIVVDYISRIYCSRNSGLIFNRLWTETSTSILPSEFLLITLSSNLSWTTGKNAPARLKDTDPFLQMKALQKS